MEVVIVVVIVGAGDLVGVGVVVGQRGRVEVL